VVPSSPVKAFDLTVRLDYGQFHLSSLPLPDGAGDDLLQLVEEAAHGQGIAVTEGNELVVVISPRAAGPLRRPHHRPRLRQPRLARVDHARRPLAPPALADPRPDPTPPPPRLDEAGADTAAGR
jgi:antitoxin (DNA-binding transcriptional repressor) of toxin-antitoxin stability system